VTTELGGWVDGGGGDDDNDNEEQAGSGRAAIGRGRFSRPWPRFAGVAVRFKVRAIIETRIGLPNLHSYLLLDHEGMHEPNSSGAIRDDLS
jgi:hypothetical protein